jgi:hypothetical protein
MEPAPKAPTSTRTGVERTGLWDGSGRASLYGVVKRLAHSGSAKESVRCRVPGVQRNGDSME